MALILLFLGCNQSNPVDPSYLISPEEAEEDLDQLNWLIENRYSYRDLKGIDYRARLDDIRGGLGDDITRGELGYELTKFMVLFGDGHTGMASNAVSVKNMCSQFLPFLAAESQGRIVAFRQDRSDFVDPNFPFLRTLDGLPLDSWLQAAQMWTPQGSTQFTRQQSIRYLRCIELLRKELGIKKTGDIDVELESNDAKSTKKISLPPANKRPIYGFWPPLPTKITFSEVEYRILPENIGYLRFVLMSEEPEFLTELIEAMKRFTDTDGIIIDLRSNGGGSRAPLKTLLPFFLEDHAPPRIVNVAAYRLGTKNRKEAFEARFLYPASSPHFSDVERKAVRDFAENFQPQWKLAEGEFSDWYYFVISPRRDQNYYFYDKPVIILQDTLDFSACDIFLGAFKNLKNITLMGLPSGGGSGAYIEYRLKNSHIKIHLSSMASFQPNGKLYEQNGIEPDIIIHPQPSYFIGKTDATLDAAIKKLSKNPP